MSFDVGIIGAGIAGAFAALRIADKYKNKKVILFDIGRKPGKRRRQLEGWLGCFPTGDGKIYPNDLERVRQVSDGRKIHHSNELINTYFKQVNPMRLIKTPSPSAAARKRIIKSNFDYETYDYYQWKPESIHKLSRVMSNKIDDAGNIHFNFDNEVYDVSRSKENKKIFDVLSEEGTYQCKKIILCTGRSGWRWASKLYEKLGLLVNNDYARYGVRVEAPSALLKDFNRSHLSIFDDDFDIGPLSWNGTVIPEDHSDLVLSAFRSNEDRWKSEKVSFSLTKDIYNKNNGVAETDRIGKLSFVLYNDRVSREKIKLFLSNKSSLNLLPEFEWLHSAIKRLEDVMPNLSTKGYFHVPNILPIPSEININQNFESDIKNFYVTGENAGIVGILSAAITGTIAADSACKGKK